MQQGIVAAILDDPERVGESARGGDATDLVELAVEHHARQPRLRRAGVAASGEQGEGEHGRSRGGEGGDAQHARQDDMAHAGTLRGLRSHPMPP